MADNNDNFRNIQNRVESLLQTRNERMNKTSITEGRILDRLKEERNKLNESFKKLREATNKSAEAMFTEEFENMQSISARVEEIQKLADRESQARQRGAKKTFMQSMRTSLGMRETASEIYNIQRLSTTQAGSIHAAENVPTRTLEGRIAKGERLIDKQGQRILDAAEDIDSPYGQKRFQSRTVVRDQLIQQVASDKANLAMQQRLKLDISNRVVNARTISGRIQSARDKEDIATNVAAGGGGSQANMKAELDKTSDELIETFNKLKEAFDGGDKSVDELAKSFDQLSKKHAMQSETLNQMQQQGMGQGFAEKLADTLDKIGEAGMMIQGAGRVAEYGMVTSTLRKRELGAQMANMANERFTDAYAAGKGDMTALRRVSTNQYDTEMKKALESAGYMDKAKLAQLTGSGLQTGSMVGETLYEAAAIGGVASAFTSPVGGFTAAYLSASEELAAATPMMESTARQGIDYFKQIPQTETLIQRKAIERQVDVATNFIQDTSSQKTFDYMKALGYSTRGLGSGRGGVQDSFADSKNIFGLAGVGVGMDDIPGIIDNAKNALGAEFRGEGAFADTKRAGTLARAGILDSPDQMFGLRGQLSGVGGKQGDLETILRQAVAQGMDSSKNIAQMVDGVTSLSQKSAAMGINVVDGASGVMGRMFQGLKGTDISENMRADVVNNAANLVNNAFTNKGLTIGTVVEQAKMKEAFPNATAMEAEIMRGLTPAELEAYKRNPALARKRGLEDLLPNEAAVDRLIGASSAGAMADITMGGTLDIQGDRAYQKKIRGEKLTSDEARRADKYIRQVGGLHNVRGETMENMFEFGKNVTEKHIDTNLDGTPRATEAFNQASATVDAQLFSSSVSKFESTIAGFNAVGEKLITIANTLDPTRLQDETKRAVDEHGIPTQQSGADFDKFHNSITGFTASMNNLVTHIGEILGKYGKSGYGQTPGSGVLHHPNPNQRRGRDY